MDAITVFVVFAMILGVCVGQVPGCQETELTNCAKKAGDAAGVVITSLDDIAKFANKDVACELAKGFLDCVNEIKPAGKCDGDRVFSDIVAAAGVASNVLSCDGSQSGSECQRIELLKCLELGVNAAGPDNMAQFIADKNIYCEFAKGFKNCVKDHITPAGKCDADKGFSVIARNIQTYSDNFKCGCGSLGASIILLVASLWFLLGQRKGY